MKIQGKIKELVSKNKTLQTITKPIHKILFRSKRFSSKQYWENRYVSGGNSGAGSYGRLAKFKAEVINQFVKEKKINSVVEFGCGDGNQLKLFKIPQYIGVDVSRKSLEMCNTMYSKDKSKSFFLYDQDAFMDNSGFFKADMTMSLDVIYHLVEDVVFDKYMRDLFSSASKYVMVYASNKEQQKEYQSQHVKHRKFTDWVEKNQPKWKLDKKIENKYPLKTNEFDQSFADFYIYKKIK